MFIDVLKNPQKFISSGSTSTDNEVKEFFQTSESNMP